MATFFKPKPQVPEFAPDNYFISHEDIVQNCMMLYNPFILTFNEKEFKKEFFSNDAVDPDKLVLDKSKIPADFKHITDHTYQIIFSKEPTHMLKPYNPERVKELLNMLVDGNNILREYECYMQGFAPKYPS